MDSSLYIFNSRAPNPSHITLPSLEQPLPTLLDFLDGRFHRVGREVWLERLQTGKIMDELGNIVDESTPYRINARLSYYREVKAEPRIPFTETILYEDEHILVADKPHFLPVTPSGKAVNECLLHRLMNRTGNKQLAPCHRLDRDTAGVVLLSKDPAITKYYNVLFTQGLIHKQYEAIAGVPEDITQSEWLVESRIEPTGKLALHHNVAGKINARSHIQLQELLGGGLGRFSLSPLTGKTHQLRLHMGMIGCWILFDRSYPQLQPVPEIPDYSRPLQLLAKSLTFTDPVTGTDHHFTSQLHLKSKEELLSHLQRG